MIPAPQREAVARMMRGEFYGKDCHDDGWRNVKEIWLAHLAQIEIRLARVGLEVTVQTPKVEHRKAT